MLSEFPRAGDVLDRAIGVLAAEFVGVFAPETVERCVRDSYRQLAEQATVVTYLPMLAQRFARERLLAARRADSVTMGCGEACPVVPGRRYEDWILAHPLGDSVDSVRSARDEIRERVVALIGSLRVAAR